MLARVGRGGMADVFLGAADGPAGVNKLVVIKRLHDGFGEDPAYVAMFLDEARLSARMNHPNIVHTFEAERVGQEYIIVMEYLDGQPLRRLIKALRDRDEHCPPTLAAHLMGEALNGLHYVHEMRDYDGTPLGIVHRDVSPQNLFVTYDGQLKVLDFGIAKATLNANDTQDGVVKGKFAYMSPEQANAAPLDRRADVFAAGVVLWELLTGKRLFHGESPGALKQNQEIAIPAPSSVASAVPSQLDAIVLKALARDPEQRFASALEMSEALSDFMQGVGQNLRHHDVAHTMQNLFGDAREEMAKRILEYMTRRATEVVPFLDGLGDANNPTQALPSTPRPEAPQTPPPPARRSRWTVGLGATLIAAVSSASAIAWRNAHPPPALKVAAQSHPAAPKGDDADHSFHLALSSDPVEAQVTWDGKVVGQTPILIDLEPGPQTFVLSMPGHFNATVVVNVTAGMAGRTESRTAMMAARDEAEARNGSDAPLALAARVAAVERARAKAAHDANAPSAPPAADIADAPKPVATQETQLVAMNTIPVPAAPAPEPEPRVAPPAPPIPAPAPVVWAPNVSTVLPFGPDMTRPTLLSGDPLIFPREAQLAHVSGAIIARCTITTEGALRSCRIIKGLPFLDQPILDSLATRRYTPVLAQGKPVSVQYVFNLKVETPS